MGSEGAGTAQVQVHGSCDRRFAAVRDAFEQNFVLHGDVGASVCVYHHGTCVVDLWAGYADRARVHAWERDTIVNVFSTGKGVVAAAVLMLVERGELSLDTPVAALWPEFGAAGKSDVTVRHVMTHTAGVPGIRSARLDADVFWNHDRFAERIAAEPPWWPAGERLAYHAFTSGYIVAEIVRRVTGTTLGAFVAKEIASPLELDLHIGTGAELEPRVAPVISPSPEETSPLTEALDDPESHSRAVLSNPSLPDDYELANRREWREAEIPAANAHANARAVARFYATLAGHGELDGVRILDPETVELARTRHVAGVDAVVPIPFVYGIGYQLSMTKPIREASRSMGHGGAGGSLGLADPEAGFGFGYTMNQLRNVFPDLRRVSLLAAVYDSVDS